MLHLNLKQKVVLIQFATQNLKQIFYVLATLKYIDLSCTLNGQLLKNILYYNIIYIQF